MTLRKVKKLPFVELTEQLNSKYNVKFSIESTDRKKISPFLVTHTYDLSHFLMSVVMN